MDVAADPVVVGAHHERDLAVDLVADETVHHMDAGFFQGPGPADVVGFVEAGLQLDDGGDLFAVGHRVHQRADDPAVTACAVERLFDGQDLRVSGGLF